jgi:hypothetical protein
VEEAFNTQQWREEDIVAAEAYDIHVLESHADILLFADSFAFGYLSLSI